MIQSAHKGEWYPFRLQRLMREQIAAQFNPDDPWTAVFDAGLFAAERETSTFLKAMLSFSSVGFILKHTATFWKKYNNTGRAQGRQVDDHHGVVELFDFPGDELFCPMMQAWLVAAGQMLKLKDAKVEETACVHRGGDCCRWELTWVPYP